LGVNVYIDGFNLYYCAVKYTPYKWLNLRFFCQTLFPSKTINEIKYFSARVKAIPWDLDAPSRQEVYWRALKTIPGLSIIEGSFVSWPYYLPKYPFEPDADGHPVKSRVQRTEEKGSDVNLAAYLVYDNCMHITDESIVLSNDSDLAKAIGLITVELKRPVTVVNPNRAKNVHRDPNHYSMSRSLWTVATNRVLSINEKILAASQFPPTLQDSKGTFSKPVDW
jgi:hypothetical protein